MRAAGQAAGMRYARWSAAVIILAVGAAAFRLSFSTLKDLAVLAHVPVDDAWLFPLIVDGTILLATFGVLVCPGRERRFFLTVLVVGSAVSVAGNSLHAVAGGQPLPAWASALVAAIAPVSLLADTHGLALLFRAAQRNSSDEGLSSAAPAAAETVGPEPAPVMALVPEPEPEPEPEREPVPASVEVPRPVAAPVKPVRSSRPVQDMLPIALPIGS